MDYDPSLTKSNFSFRKGVDGANDEMTVVLATPKPRGQAEGETTQVGRAKYEHE